MDGVLIDSECAIRTCCIKALKSFGINASHEDFFEFTGMGEDSFIGGVVRKHGGVYTEDMKTLSYDYYVKEAEELVVVFDGIKEMLLTLKNKGIKLAVASAADRIKVAKNLECIGIDVTHFNAVITGSDITHKKPDPEIYLTAACKISSLPGSCIVVEDAISGVKAAKAAGMRCIGVTSAFDAKTLKDTGADFIVENTPEIIEIIDRLNKAV